MVARQIHGQHPVARGERGHEGAGDEQAEQPAPGW